MDALARHQCMIYGGSPAKHLPGLAALMYGKLKTNRRCLYLNSPTMVAGIRSYLAAAGLDVEHEVAKGALVLSSDQNHLTNGRFDVNTMLGMLVDAVNRALKDGYEGLWATGDMTWELGSEKNFDKLLEYERGLEEIFRQHPTLCGVCQYHQDMLPIDAIEKSLRTHQAVYINATLSLINPFYASLDSTAHSPGPDSSIQLEAMLKRLGRPLDS